MTVAGVAGRRVHAAASDRRLRPKPGAGTVGGGVSGASAAGPNEVVGGVVGVIMGPARLQIHSNLPRRL